MAIKFCPNCKGDLKDKATLAQHVKECVECKARYFTIETTSPKIIIDEPQTLRTESIIE